MIFTAASTGSSSARLLWDPTQAVPPTLTVFRGTTSVFGAATNLGSVAFDAGLYNDYTAAANTPYWYWLQDSNNVVSGPVTVTTDAVTVTAMGLDEPQKQALYTWAFNALGGLCPVSWRYQAIPRPYRPRVVLNINLVRKAGFSDSLQANGEGLIGDRIATVSVAVYSDSQPAPRGLVNVLTLGTGNYTVTVNGVPFTQNYGTAPANGTVVTTALATLLQAAGFTVYLNGIDPTNQGLIIQNQDPRAPLTLSSTGNLGASVYTPSTAMVLAQVLQASLDVRNNAVRDALNAAGIGVGTVNDPLDLPAMEDMEAELTAQFDFFANLASVLAISGPIIDTVTSVDGTTTN